MIWLKEVPTTEEWLIDTSLFINTVSNNHSKEWLAIIKVITTIVKTIKKYSKIDLFIYFILLFDVFINF